METGEAIERQLAKGVMQMAVEHGQMTYPLEGCGLFLRRKQNQMIDLFAPCRNIQNELHRQDPERYPRTARQAYAMDSREIAELQKRFQKNHEICGIFHTHNDVGVYFSDEDLAMACPWGEPLFPGQFYVIMGFEKGDVQACSIFTWQDKTRSFEEFKLTRSFLNE